MSNPLFATIGDTTETFNIGPASSWIAAIEQAANELLEQNTTVGVVATRGDAVPKDDDCIQVGECFTYTPHVCVDSILERWQEHAYDECGEASESWLNNISQLAKRALADKLQPILDEFLKEQGEIPTFGSIPRPVMWYWNRERRAWIVAAQLLPVDGSDIPTIVEACMHGIPSQCTCRHCEGPQN